MAAIASKAKDQVTPGGLAGALARKAAKAMMRRMARSGAEAVRTAADRVVDTGRGAIGSNLVSGIAVGTKRPPIQVSVDVAVPLPVAWEEWMTFESMTEGVHRVEEVERDGDSLFGTLAGPRGGEWEAEIVDEREGESFAWRTVEGSDCAGLITFHRLSDRLTRLELDLDVVPTGPAESLALALRVADRRAEAELRRFKADVEFISPDVYEDQLQAEEEPAEDEPEEPDEADEADEADEPDDDH